jgi:hypothetical protein
MSGRLQIRPSCSKFRVSGDGKAGSAVWTGPGALHRGAGKPLNPVSRGALPSAGGLGIIEVQYQACGQIHEASQQHDSPITDPRDVSSALTGLARDEAGGVRPGGVFGFVGQNPRSCANVPPKPVVRGPLAVWNGAPVLFTIGVDMFLVSHKIEDIGGAATIEAVREIVRREPPGRYVVVEIRAEPFPSGHTRRAWGRMIRRPDGRVETEPWPWQE